MSKYHSTQVELSAMATAGKEIKVDHHALSITLTQDVISSMLYEYATLLRERESAEPVAWMTHHDEPMLFPTEWECVEYCADDERPIPLYTHPKRESAKESDDELPGMWSAADFIGGDPDERSYAERESAQKLVTDEIVEHVQYSLDNHPDNRTYAEQVSAASVRAALEAVAPMLASARSVEAPAWPGYSQGEPPPKDWTCMDVNNLASARVPDGWRLVPQKFGIPADAWHAAQFAFGGPGTGDDEPFMDCTAWIGELTGDEGEKIQGLHIWCDECPEVGSITLAEFPAAPKPEKE